jgi:hypothetical protein
LNTINDIVYENAKASGQQMEEKENMKTNELKLQIGDYVYLQCQPTGVQCLYFFSVHGYPDYLHLNYRIGFPLCHCSLYETVLDNVLDRVHGYELF